MSAQAERIEKARRAYADAVLAADRTRVLDAQATAQLARTKRELEDAIAAARAPAQRAVGR